MTERLRQQAKNKEHFDQMVTFFGNTEDEEYLKTAILLFVLDMRYARSDIVLAEKYIRRSKGL